MSHRTAIIIEPFSTSVISILRMRLLATSTKICITMSSMIDHSQITSPHFIARKTSYTWDHLLPRLSFGSIVCLTTWAPSVFGVTWFCRWVITQDSLRGCRLPRPPSYCPHHIEHPFAFIGNLEWSRLSTKLNSRVSGWIPHRQSCLPENGPRLPLVGWWEGECIIATHTHFTQILKFERRPRSSKEINPQIPHLIALPHESHTCYDKAILRETSDGTSYQMVRWVFRPYAQVRR